MADEYGLELVIPDGFIEKLQKADEELEYTAMQAEETKESVIKAFREMGDQGVDYFLKKLNEMQKALGNISTKNINLKNLENSTKSIAKGADDVVRIADAFGQVSTQSTGMDGAIKNINTQLDGMWERLKQVRSDIELYYQAIGSGHKEEMQFGQEGLKRANEEAEQLMKRIEALEVTRAKLEQSGDVSMLGVQKTNQEMAMLNEAYRTGTSELQKQAKAEDDKAKQMAKEAKEQAKLAKQQAQEDERHQKALEKQQKEQERINKAKEEEQRKTYQGAMSYSSNAKNMLEDANAIKYLEAARAKLDRTDSDYTIKLKTLNNAIIQHKKNIATAKGESVTFERQQRSLINTADQLKRKLALVFSVSAITGYFKKMVEVRGEFELQKVALTAILQNKEKADELWAKTQELALQSPFKLQQLVTFTKQLAAYQVEADKLYDTNKRLADVSAGLGVEMNRLILAFGQVKAANYLRSAEIRQFTEAGINMLGELSKLYTEIEGKMVSVGEVQARVQKRLVSFADVEEVFKRMTDAGGMFYNMQEKQAETLKGMIAKLSDALDIMLNQVGEANEGVLKGMVNTLLKILQSWEKIGQVAIPIITILVSRMVLLKTVTAFGGDAKIFKGLIEGLKLAAAQAHLTKLSFTEMRAAVSASATAFSGWTAILSAALIVLFEITGAIRAHTKEQKELNKVVVDSTFSAHKMAARYETLVKTIQDQTSSFQDQKDAIDELRRTYGDILPAELLEIENIRTMGGEYDKAREAIYSYMEAKAKQKQLEVVEANEGADLQREQNKLITSLVKSMKKKGVPVERMEVAEMIRQIIEAQQQGMIETVRDAREMLIDLIEKTYEVTLSQNDLYYAGLDLYQGTENVQRLENILDAAKAYYDKIDEVTASSIGIFDASTRRLKTARKEFDKANEDIKEAFNAVQNYDLLTEDQKKEAIATLKGFYDKLVEEMPDWSKVSKDPLLFDEETRRFNKMWLDAMVADVSAHFNRVEKVTDSTTQVLRTSWDKFVEDVEKEISTQNIDRWQVAVAGAIEDFAKEHEYTLDGMSALVLKAGQTEEDYFKGVKGEVDRLKQDIGQLEIYKEKTPAYLWNPENDRELARMQEMLAIYEYIYSLYYDAKQEDKASDKADREALNLLKERVRLIQEANKEYEKNLQYFTEEEAVAKTLNSYKNAFKQAGISNLLDKQFLTDEGVLKALAQLPINVGGKLRDEALQYMADSTAKVSVELDIDASQRALKDLKTKVEGLFDGIDIFQDLVKIGFTEEEVRRIFGIEITNTDQLRRRLESMKDEFIGTKGLDEYNAFMRKINEMEDKQNVERLKRYEKYLKTMMSETAEIRIQALQDIQDVMKMSGRSSEEKNAIIEGINREAQKKLQEQQWKQFQESDDYQLLFSDIEHLSTTTASRLKDILDNLRTSLNELTPHQLRQIQAQYEKLDEQIIKHNPFDAVKKSLKEIEGLSRESDLNDTIASLTQEKMGYAENIDALDVLINIKQKGLSIDQLDAKTQEKISGLQHLSVEELTIMRQQQQGYIDSVIAELGLTEEQLNKYKRLRKAMSEAQETWNSVMGQTRQTLSDIKGAYEAMNDGTQSITLEMVDAGLALADATYQAVQLYQTFVTIKSEAPALGAALNTALGIIGLIATAVQTIINVINMIASAHDKEIEEDIKRYERRVDKLAEAYDRLADKMQKAYSFAMLSSSTNDSLTNIQEQITAYESMIAYEQNKKESDSDKIEDWTDKVAELQGKMQEVMNEAVREAGGLGGEYKDAAQGFVDAWIDAFRETGNGLDALNEHFEDFLWDIASKQVLLRAADKFFEPLFEELDTRMTADTSAYDKREKELIDRNNQIKDTLSHVLMLPQEYIEQYIREGKINLQGFQGYWDEYEANQKKIEDVQRQRDKAIQDALMLDDDDLEALKKQYEVSGKNFDEFAKNLLASLGYKGGEGGDVLSGLQKGIQGITESTAEIIEAYLNSVRFFVSDSNQKLSELLERFASNEDTRNPILAELKLQTDYLWRICQRVESAFAMTGYRTDGTGYVKVQY